MACRSEVGFFVLYRIIVPLSLILSCFQTIHAHEGPAYGVAHETQGLVCKAGEKCDLDCGEKETNVLEGVTNYEVVWTAGDTKQVLTVAHSNASESKTSISAAYKNRTEVRDGFSLRLLRTRLSDGEVFRCAVNSDAKMVHEKKTNVTVIKLPNSDKPEIEPGVVKQEMNSVENVTCSISGAYPAAHLVWTKLSGDASLQQGEEVITENNDQTFNTERRAKIKWGQRASQFSCEATHPGLKDSRMVIGKKESAGEWILPVVIIVILLIAAGIVAILLILYRKRTQGQADYKLRVPVGDEGRELKDMSKKGGLSAFHDAAKSGNADELTKILDKNATVLNQQDEEGWTALHWASAYGHADIVKGLLEKKVNIGTKNKAGDTPEDLATSHKHEDIVTILQDAQAAQRLVEEA